MFRAVDIIGEENIKKVMLGEDKIVGPMKFGPIKTILGESALFFQTGKRHLLLRGALLKAFTNRVSIQTNDRRPVHHVKFSGVDSGLGRWSSLKK